MYLLTAYCADWSLWGGPATLALTGGAVVALATAGFRFPPAGVQLRLVAGAPVFFLLFALLTRYPHGLGFPSKCYFAQLDVAFIVSFAFAVAFTLGALRGQHWFCRGCGWCCVPVVVWLSYETFRVVGHRYDWWGS